MLNTLLKLSMGLLVVTSLPIEAAWQVPDETQQLVVVTTDDWDGITGTLQTYVRTDNGWEAQPYSSGVTIGRTGSAWGIGLHPAQPGQQKKEGDGKAPAGIFALTSGFGYEALSGLEIPYQQMQGSHYCMDVNDSAYYNQIVDASVVGEDAVEGSSEGMRRDLHYGDELYRQGVFVAHNPKNVPGAGSCIFLHLWRGDDKPTAGCTAMPAEVMDKLIRWLDADDAPAMVLLPRGEYIKRQSAWGLPAL
ncbi:L,D-transpeptidase family protein [Lacimicrobium alkaliphilum]|uniref:L,D-TPase catalytic domain-containing protein n=1 Tax=Lacimicrobium alkaliphilum TaxID=1526571 RepID=A0ABQ1RML9_9ALTE|nr:L,D-transpeptidase family protein [Lacimicrobium alkaliphilum]GGD75000.1 hypothetical protein GCM10011357_32470 [Lacimicrobium alkaliphilum]